MRLTVLWRDNYLQRLLLFFVSVYYLFLPIPCHRRQLSHEQLQDADAEASAGEADASAEKSGEELSLGTATAPDARLVLFLSGIFLSQPVRRGRAGETLDLPSRLLEAWSVGLLSASAPWRMVCALTAANVLNLHPGALADATGRIPTLEWLYGRLGSIVARKA